MSFKEKLDLEKAQVVSKYRHSKDDQEMVGIIFDCTADFVLKELASGGEYDRKWIDTLPENQDFLEENDIAVYTATDEKPQQGPLEFLARVKEYISIRALSAERAKRIEAEERADIAENAMLEIESQNVELHRRIADEQSGIQDRTLEKHLRWELSACESRLKEAEKVILYFADLGSKRALQYMEKVK